MRELFELVKRRELARSRGERLVLATLVKVEGTTYRKPGARALIGAAGDVTGLVSGGCLEADLAAHAARLGKAHAKRVTYDFRDATDDDFGLGSGCRGAFEVLLETLPVQGETSGERTGPCTSFDAIERLVRGSERRSVRRALVHRAEGAWAHLLGRTIDSADGDAPAELRTAFASANEGSSLVRGPDGIAELFVETLDPIRSLAIFGAGPDAMAVAEAATFVGYRVTVFDHRSELLERWGSLPTVARTCVDLGNVRTSLAGFAVDAAVVMTHSLRADAAFLGALAPIHREAPIPYLGVLGPRARAAPLVAEAGLPDAHVSGPIGLDIHARDPHSIALAIVSEIASVLGHGSRVHGVVLAAGAATRFGGPKAIAELHGTPLVVRAVRALRSGGVRRIVVVTGAEAEAVERAVANEFESDSPGLIRFVRNTEWSTGVASSIRAGVLAHPLDASLFIAAADQPALTNGHVASMVRAHGSRRATVVSAYDGTLGVPALFGPAERPRLLALLGDEGARAILRTLASKEGAITSVDLPEGSLDVDTPKDLARAQRAFP